VDPARQVGPTMGSTKAFWYSVKKIRNFLKPFALLQSSGSKISELTVMNILELP
jgi:hypothetical protein